MSTLQAPQHEYRDYAALLDDYYERGGPTASRSCRPRPRVVDEFLAAARLEPDDVLGAVPTRAVVVTAEHVAINAVMAGCRADYMPVVVAAVRAHLDEKGNCHSDDRHAVGRGAGGRSSTVPSARLDVNCARAASAPGGGANATIGRALRLVIRNVCRAMPASSTAPPYSTPARYSFCFGEDEEGERPGAAERRTRHPGGHQRSHRALDDDVRAPPSTSPAARPRASSTSIAARHPQPRHRAATSGSATSTTVVLVVGPEHRRFFVEAGWSKADVRNYLWPRLRADRAGRGHGRSIAQPEGILIVAAGGPGMAETWMIFPHLAWAITEPVAPGSGQVAIGGARDRRTRSLPAARCRRPQQGPAARTSRSRARSSASCRTASAASDEILRARRPTELGDDQPVPARSCSCASPACRCRRIRSTGRSSSPQVTVAVAGFGG